MMPLSARIGAILLAGLLAASCSSFEAPNTQAESKGPDKAAVAARKATAKRLARKGDLAAALVQWRILEIVDRGNSSFAKKRRALEAKIERQAAVRYDQGRKALSERQPEKARQEFLAALALDPSHEGAIKQLRDMELKVVRRNRPKVATPDPKPSGADVAKKTPEPKPEPKKALTVQAKATAKKAPAAQANATAKKKSPAVAKVAARTSPSQPSDSEALHKAMGLAEKGAFLDSIPHFREHLSQFPKDTKAQNFLATSHREVGIALYNDGKLRESLSHLEASFGFANGSDTAVAAALTDAKGRLAKASYEKGVRVFRSDVEKAIAFWEETLNYDPAHIKAKSYLNRAYKIQETLNSLAED